MLRSWLRTLHPPAGAVTVAASLALAALVLLPKGKVLGGPTAVAYAEVIHHPVGPVAAGRLRELRVHVGQHVQAGELIALMDDRALQVSRERSQAELAQLQARVDAALEDQESQVTRSELWVLRAQAAEQADRAALQQVDRQAQRLEGLLASQMIAATEVESTRERQSSLAARVKTYDQARGLGSLDSLSKASRRHHAAVNTRIEPYRQAVRVQQAALRQVELALDELSLRAPVDGLVSVLNHQPGDVVQAGTEVVTLVTARPGVVVALVPERTAASIDVGRVTKLRRDTLLSPELEGRVIEISPEVEEVPQRARPSPNIPAWGRRVVIELSHDKDVLPGEAFHVSF